ncbi:efflux RND transporter periplasmic adaptor subunit [Telmatospirillum sp. J64-1]|uniref:efflux RND transporter periplasmic adaptor subunit n=1 Tax=Telmatospirillum sp. J64-1 TaxID=2502183 RepID=UPI00115E7E0A|nr:efflux RND transporter periplasmic adaptor subunit [Telmatospirillum sp. J64-1]
MRKALLAVAAIAVAGAAGWYWQMGGFLPNTPPAQAAGPAALGGAPPAVPVEAAVVTVGRMARELTAVGTVISNESVIIRPEIAGRVSEILFQEGERVRQGQLLLRLDDTIDQAAVAQAEANLALARSNRDRTQQLHERGAAASRSRDEAEATLRVDQAQLELARAQLEKTRIHAPFDGIVGLRKVSVGAYVAPGQDVVNLENIDPIKVEFRIPEVHLGALAVGQPLTVTGDAYPGREFSGSIYAIDPQIDQAGRNVVVRAVLPNEDHALRPGLFVRLTLAVDEVLDAISVPEQAVVPQGNASMVIRVVEGRAQMVPVTLGRRGNGMVQVLEGLAPGDVVVTAGQMKLRPDAPVAVVGATPGV